MILLTINIYKQLTSLMQNIKRKAQVNVCTIRIYTIVFFACLTKSVVSFDVLTLLGCDVTGESYSRKIGM